MTLLISYPLTEVISDEFVIDLLFDIADYSSDNIEFALVHSRRIKEQIEELIEEEDEEDISNCISRLESFLPILDYLVKINAYIDVLA